MRIRLLAFVLLFCPAAVAALAQAAATSSACARCHATQALWQPSSQMGRALQRKGDNPTLNAHPRLAFTKDRYTYTVQTSAGLSKYTVSDGTNSVTLPISWSVGADAQTWIVEKDGIFYESLVSYYPVLQGLDITTGDERLHPATLLEAIGRPLSTQDAKACFNCHATNALKDHMLDLHTLQPGLTCERCHTDAGAHLARILHGDKSFAPQDLGGLSTEAMSNFCGQCHRTWDTVVRAHWTGIPNVRFQPYRLANSRCYDGADSRIGCTACHDPHAPVKHDVAFYDTKCLACHAPAITASANNKIHAKSCPVGKSDCASCHMPRFELPNGHMTFTDHQIRVVKPGEPYPN